jgi:hypothetical protein
MTSDGYVDVYLGLWCWVNDTFTVARVRNYLQSGMGGQSIRAQTAKAALLAGLAKRLGKYPGRTFELQGDQYILTSIERVFMGKGAPDEIQGVIWLASLCGLVTPETLAAYCDQNLGVDCGGFVANYWGMGHPVSTAASVEGDTGISPRTIWGKYPTLRRRTVAEIQVDDAAIFFEDVQVDNPDIIAKKVDGKYDPTTGSQAFHIGLVSAKSATPATGNINLDIAESSGAPSGDSGGNGVRVRHLVTVSATVANNLVYCPDGKNRIYFIGRPSATPPYMPNSFGA